jgi:hypothetical protein
MRPINPRKVKIRKPKRADAIIERLPKNRPIIGVEIGTWKGSTAVRLLAQMPNLFLHMVDRWEVPPPGDSYFRGSLKIVNSPQSEFDAAERRTRELVRPYRGRYKIHKMISIEAARLFEDESLDFVFVDSDHSYEGCITDIRAWFPKVKRGGILCGHDYNHPDQGEVKKAVDEIFGRDIILSYSKTWFHYKK